MSQHTPEIAFEIIKKIQAPDFNDTIPFFQQFNRVRNSAFVSALEESHKLIYILLQNVDIRILPNPYKSTLETILSSIPDSEEENSTNEIAVMRLEKTKRIIKKHLDDWEKMHMQIEFR